MSFVDRFVPDRLVRGLTRYAIPLTVIAVVLLLAGAAAVATFVGPGIVPGANGAETRVSETATLPDTLRASVLSKEDQDRDGLADALENYYYGTDPANWNSSGTGIPDGWLTEFGYDPLNPALGQMTGAVPPRSELPDAYDGKWPEKFHLPLAAYYAYGVPADYEPGESDPWWDAPGADAVDPSRWDQSGSGIPTSWLIHYGLDPFDARIGDRPAAGGESPLTVNESFAYNTNPLEADSDGDGLDDDVEINEVGTDPSRFSTTGLGVADGWLVHYGISPLDPAATGEDLDRDGLSNADEFFASHERFREQVDAEGIRVLYDRGLDPTNWETSGSGIPDGWYVTFGLDPLDANEADRVLQRASDYAGYRHHAGDPDLPEDAEPLPDLEMTVRDAYTYNRPADWDEGVQGVWWGGTDPNNGDGDSDGDGLPDAVEIRGWYVTVSFGVGSNAASVSVVNVTSNPMKADSDDDGLTDAEEYEGRTFCGDTGSQARTFPITNPQNKDTAFSGITDLDKVCGVVRGPFTYDLYGAETADGGTLDPTRADSAGDGLKDGAKLDEWHERYARYVNDPTYEYEGSRFGSVFEWTRDYARFGRLTEEQAIEQFRPDGDVDGDGLVNVLDADPSGGLVVERWAPGEDATSVYMPQKEALEPTVGQYPRAPVDPANPDTDGDGLPDYWEASFNDEEAWNNDAGNWHLDPARYDSDGDGTPDGDENPDDQPVLWSTYVDGQRFLQTPYEYTNLQEFEYGTNPLKVASEDDGISDAWKAFWGREYPIRVQSGDAGDVVPTGDAFSRILIDPGSDLTSQTSKEKLYVYARFAYVETTDPVEAAEYLESEAAGGDQLRDGTRVREAFGADAMAELRDDVLTERPELAEAFDHVGASGQALIPKAGPEGQHVARIVGVYRLDFAREAAIGTNPYLFDTDGDGIPDVYEDYYRDLDPNGGPSPVVPDGRLQLDDDAFSNLDECGTPASLVGTGVDVQFCPVGTNPLVADTDLDGIPDDFDFADPVNPSSEDAGNRDTDGDGLNDLNELTGWGGSLAIYDGPRRTSSTQFDGDGDGLLDVGNRPVGDVENADFFIPRWDRHGVAWLTRSSGEAVYLGERAKTDPCKPDTSGDGIPDGWIGYYFDAGVYTSDVGSDASEFTANYAFGKPGWWLDPTDADRCSGTGNHGVWWWGLPPTTDATDVDLDNDGLHDGNGEDPFPAHGMNRYVYDGVNLTNPDDVEGFVNAADTPDEMRARAQALGEWPGNPIGGRDNASTRDLDGNGVPDVRDRASTRITGVTLTGAADALADGYAVEKGVNFTVTGQVELDETVDQDGPVDLSNQTVLVSLMGPDRSTLIGAGFTDAEGRFTLDANLTADQGLDHVPQGSVLLGKTEGPVTWRVDTGVVGTGEMTGSERNRLVVWTYNTSQTLRQYDANARLRNANGFLTEAPTRALAGTVSDPVNLTVESKSVLTIDLPDPQVIGDELRGNVTLTDAGGAPIARTLVTLEWTGSDEPITRDANTDASGRIDLAGLGIPIDASAPQLARLSADFVSNVDSLHGDLTSASTQIVYPSRITVTADRTETNVGADLVVRGTLRTLPVDGEGGVPVDDVIVDLELGSARQEVRTNPEGRFETTVRVPPDLNPGDATLVARFGGNDEVNAARGELPLTVRRTTEIVNLERLTARAGGDLTLTGNLVDNEGNGIRGSVSMVVNGRTLDEGGSGDGGFFVLRGSLRGIPLGLHEVNVVFDGDDRYSGTSNVTTVKVVSPAGLEITHLSDPVVRGEYLRAEGRLLDNLGSPIQGAAVEVTLRGQGIGYAITDGQGRFTFTGIVNETERLGEAAVGFRYTPAESSAYRPAILDRTVHVQSAADVVWEDLTLRRGTQSLFGRVLDDRALALGAMPVTLTFNGEEQTARTARNGSFVFHVTVPNDLEAGAYPATVTFDGTDTHAPSAKTATLTLKSDTRIVLDNLGPVIRGEPLNLHGEVLEDNDDGITGTLQFTIGGVDVGELTVRNGVFNATLDVPIEVPRGEQTLTLTYEGTEFLEPATYELPVLVKIRPQVDLDVPQVTLRGFAFEGAVQVLDDQGEPLRDAPFVYTIGSDRQTFLGRTDENGKAVIGGVGHGDSTRVLLAVQAGPGIVPAEVETSAIRVVNPALGGSLGLLAAAAGVLLLGATALGVYLWRRRRQIEEVRDILDEAITAIEAGNPYAGTIFLAYKRLVAHLGQYGFIEQESDTAREFVLGVRRAVPVSPTGMRGLIRLFEKARYSEETILATDRDEALTSLVNVRKELDAVLGDRPQEGDAS